MTFKDVELQKGKYIDGIELMVVEVEEPYSTDYGLAQTVMATDSAGQTQAVTVYTASIEFVLEKNYEGKQSVFRLRHKNNIFNGFPSEIEPPKTVETKDDYWDKVNLGKCRHGILCAILSSGKVVTDTILDEIEELAQFSMYGKDNHEHSS